MALAELNRMPITIHHVVLEFLRGERTNFNLPHGMPLLDAPTLTSPLENHQRLRILYSQRAIFMVEIPTDTNWWEVHGLTDNDLDELCVSARHNERWNVGGYKLKNVGWDGQAENYSVYTNHRPCRTQAVTGYRAMTPPA
jgi:hypothetical protein